MDFYLDVIVGLFSLTLLILAAVNKGSVDKIKEDSEHVKNTKRTSTGILTLSVVMLLVAAYNLYQHYPSQSKNIVYYF